MFCSSECQQAAEKEHKLECRILSYLFKQKFDCNKINVMKIILKAGFEQLSSYLESKVQVEDKRTAGFTNGKYDATNFNAVYHSQTTSRKRLFEEHLIALLTSSIFIKLLSDMEPNASEYGGIIYHLFWCVHTNGNEMREVYMGQEFPFAEHDVCTGYSFSPTCNLINHSCDPTLGRDYYGFCVVARAIKPVKKGEGLTIAYHHRFTYFKKSERQMLLFLSNGFKCKCEACEGDWPLVDDMPMYPSFSNEQEKRAYVICAKQLNSLHDQVRRGEIITSGMAFRFIKHLTLLSRLKGGRLCENFNLCQQALEQYWARQSNYFIDKYM